VTRAVQLQPNPKRGRLNEDETSSRKHRCVPHIFLHAHGGPNANAASTPEKNKSADASAAPKTLRGIVSDRMCGAHHMEKDKSRG
jgi:hypothetical protein